MINYSSFHENGFCREHSFNEHYLSIATHVAEGLVFRKHTVCSSCLTWHFILARNLQTKISQLAQAGVKSIFFNNHSRIVHHYFLNKGLKEYSDGESLLNPIYDNKTKETKKEGSDNKNSIICQKKNFTRTMANNLIEMGRGLVTTICTKIK